MSHGKSAGRIQRCHTCDYPVLDEDTHICKNCNDVLEHFHDRWGSTHGIHGDSLTWEEK